MVGTAAHRGQRQRRRWSGMKLTPVLALAYMDYMDYLYIKRDREENVEVYRHGRSRCPGGPGGPTDAADPCERCGTSDNTKTFDTLTLCERCLLLILKEWRIRRAEFEELAAS